MQEVREEERSAVVVRPRRPEWPPEHQWEWIVLVGGVHVGTGRRAECEALAEELRADRELALSVVETIEAGGGA